VSLKDSYRLSAEKRIFALIVLSKTLQIATKTKGTFKGTYNYTVL